jgi:hypothetical protein
MAMFNRNAPPNRRPEATEEFRLALDKAIAAARYERVDPRTLADHLEGQAQALRMYHAMTTPVV